MTRAEQRGVTVLVAFLAFFVALVALELRIPWNDNQWTDYWTRAIIPAGAVAWVVAFLLALWFTRE